MKQLIGMIAALILLGCAGQGNLFGDRRLIPVDLVYFGPARSVCLVGDFNSWNAGKDCMRRVGQSWRITLSLPPGTYHYAFIVDGLRWVPDPGALWSEKDDFGQGNSILIVQ